MLINKLPEIIANGYSENKKRLKVSRRLILFLLFFIAVINWLRGTDLNRRPSGYEPDELPDCSTPRYFKFYFLAYLIF